MISKRRVLGDITNSTSSVLPIDQNETKKPSIRTSVLSSVLRTNSIVAQDSERNIPPPAAPQTFASIAPPTVPERSYMLREVDDIDSRDAGNPLLVTSLVNDMYEHFHQLEQEYRVNYGYIKHQEFINEHMRAILVDWLVEVHLKFKMVPESLYITVQIIDRFLSQKSVKRSKLQLVGVSALLVAAKYEEIFAPELKELVYITDKAYSKEEILEMERDILVTLDYRFTVPTVHSFVCRYLKAAHADRPMVQLSCYLTERTLQEYSMLRFLPSQIAATAVMIARMTLKRHPWSPTLLKYSGYDEVDLTQCAQAMRAAMSNAGNQQQAVQRKYSSPKFGQVAKMALTFH